MKDKKNCLNDPVTYLLAVVDGMEIILNKLVVIKENEIKQSLLGRKFPGMNLSEVRDIIAQEAVDMILTKYERRK